MRVWNESTAALPAAGSGLAPLAILANESARNPDAAVERLYERFDCPDVPKLLSRQLTGSTFFPADLRYNDAQIDEFRTRFDMTLEDSTSYQMAMRMGAERGRLAGKLESARSFPLRLGTKRFGPPPAAALARLQAVTNPDLLEPLAECVLDAASWDDLVAGL